MMQHSFPLALAHEDHTWHNTAFNYSLELDDLILYTRARIDSKTACYDRYLDFYPAIASL